jgi:hypothetical protein
MITLEKLTNELQINKIDEVYGGWTTTGGSSGGDDRSRYTIRFLGSINLNINIHWSLT